MPRHAATLALLLLASCATDETTNLDGSGGACTVSADCSNGETCNFTVPGCNSSGRCTTNTCDDNTSFTVYCGCAGDRVFGDQSCSPEPYDRVQTNSAPCEGVVTGRDAGPSLSNCTVTADCPSGYLCEFTAGSCGQTGMCRELNSCIGDAGVGTFCDCNGNTFMGGTFCIDHPFQAAGPCPGGRDGGVPMPTWCVDRGCDPATEVCVIEEALMQTGRCEPIPAGCDPDRTCGCFPNDFCGGPQFMCVDDAADNTVRCTCPAC